MTKLPTEWKKKKINDIANLSSGGTPSRKKPEYWNGTIPWVTTSSINFNIITDVDEYITDEGLSNSSTKMFPINTILIAMYGQGETRGRVGILGIEACTNQACAAVIVSPENDFRFVFYYLANQYLNIRELSHGGSQKNLNQSLVGSIPILIPPLAEQRAIAEILSTWDEAITLTQALIEALQQRKKGLMQQLLTGKTRFPDFNDEWEEVRLGDVFSRVKRKVSGDIAEVLSITATVGFVSQKEKFGKVIAGKNLARYIRLKRGDFAYNKGNSIPYPQGCIYCLDEYIEGAVPNVYYCFRVNSKELNEEFYKYYFEFGTMNEQLTRIINTGVRNDGLLNISADDFFNMTIQVPIIGEQVKISALFELLDIELNNLYNKLESLQQQKKGLMQQLLTGKVRVNVEG